MKKQLITLLFALIPMGALAASGEGVHLQHMSPDLSDQPSLQRGMKLYVNYCMGCHSLEYQRFSRAAEDLGIPEELVVDNLIFSPELGFNDQMHRAMLASDAENWFGQPPPDLTLEARLRGTDWIYSYLLSFYRDSERLTGVDNLVFPSVGMPNVLESLQGVQERTCVAQGDAEEHPEGDGCRLELVSPGRMSAAEFEQAVYDLTNFLAYVGEPSKLQAQSLAPKVLIFLFIFGVIAYLLKREYWRDIH